jgi:AraC-like DNA-binding protein
MSALSKVDRNFGRTRDPAEFPDAPPGLPADLTRALGWLRSHLAEPIQLDLLAQIAGVRPRTLETHFKMFLGTTPLGWVRRMRLARARQELLHTRPPASVTDVALANGFSQLGRFAGQYRRLFGELPSATLQRSTNLSTSGCDPDLDEATRLTLGALPLAFGLAAKKCNAALEELERPQELAPIYGLPKAVAAWCWGQRAAHGFGSTPEVDRQRAYSLAEEAAVLGAQDALTLTLSSGALVWCIGSQMPTGASNERWRSIRGWPTDGSAAGGCRLISGTATGRCASSGPRCISCRSNRCGTSASSEWVARTSPPNATGGRLAGCRVE